LVALRTRIAFAGLLAMRADAGAKRRARSLATEARQSAREIGLPAREREIDEILASLD